VGAGVIRSQIRIRNGRRRHALHEVRVSHETQPLDHASISVVPSSLREFIFMTSGGLAVVGLEPRLLLAEGVRQ
jgi:hypothetical protein